MSFLKSHPTKLTDLDLIHSALLSMGATYNMDKTKIRTHDGLRHCDRSYSFEGTDYDLGIVEAKDGTYSVNYDTFSRHGQAISEKIGMQNGIPLSLVQKYREKDIERAVSRSKFKLKKAHAKTEEKEFAVFHIS